MLTLLFSFSIAGMATLEQRRGWLWGISTFFALVLIQVFLISGYWGAVLGFFGMFAAMTYAKIKYPINKGPTLRADSFIQDVDHRQDK